MNTRIRSLIISKVNAPQIYINHLLKLYVPVYLHMLYFYLINIIVQIKIANLKLGD